MCTAHLLIDNLNSQPVPTWWLEAMDAKNLLLDLPTVFALDVLADDSAARWLKNIRALLENVLDEFPFETPDDGPESTPCLETQ